MSLSINLPNSGGSLLIDDRRARLTGRDVVSSDLGGEAVGLESGCVVIDWALVLVVSLLPDSQRR